MPEILGKPDFRRCPRRSGPWALRRARGFQVRVVRWLFPHGRRPVRL